MILGFPVIKPPLPDPIAVVQQVATPSLDLIEIPKAKYIRPDVANKAGNSYGYRQCTYHAKSKRPDLPNFMGNAINWPSVAKAYGYGVGTDPEADAIGQQGNHVVYIEKVEGDLVYISEFNWDYRGSYRERWANASDFTYIY